MTGGGTTEAFDGAVCAAVRIAPLLAFGTTDSRSFTAVDFAFAAPALGGAILAAAGPAEIAIDAWQLGQTAFMPACNASTSQGLRQRGHVSVRICSARRVRI